MGGKQELCDLLAGKWGSEQFASVNIKRVIIVNQRAQHFLASARDVIGRPNWKTF